MNDNGMLAASQMLDKLVAILARWQQAAVDMEFTPDVAMPDEINVPRALAMTSSGLCLSDPEAGAFVHLNT